MSLIHHLSWMCPICENPFDERKAFLAHLGVHMAAAVTDERIWRKEKFECDGCLHVFDSKADYNQHAETCIHAEPIEEAKC